MRNRRDAWINLHDNRPRPQERVEKEQSAPEQSHRGREKIQAHYYSRTDHFGTSWACGFLPNFERDDLKSSRRKPLELLESMQAKFLEHTPDAPTPSARGQSR